MTAFREDKNLRVSLQNKNEKSLKQNLDAGSFCQPIILGKSHLINLSFHPILILLTEHFKTKLLHQPVFAQTIILPTNHLSNLAFYQGVF